MTYLPFADVSVNPLTIFTIGLMAGIIEGVFGTLSNLLAVPALIIFGLPLPISASTNIGQSVGRTSIFIFRGNRDGLAFCRVGAVAGIAGLPGVFLGLKLHLSLIQTGFGEDIVRLCHVALLLAGSVVLYRQWSFFNRNDYYDDDPFPPFGLNWRFPLAVPGESGLNRITLARVTLVGLLLGTGTGFLGLGAGVLGIPLFMYILGLPARNAAATDTVTMLLIGSGSLAGYALSGRVEFAAVLIFLTAVTLGSRIGTLLPGEIHLGHAKLAFSLMLAATAVCTAVSVSGQCSTRMAMSICGLAFFTSMAVFILVPEKFWSGRIARLLRGIK